MQNDRIDLAAFHHHLRQGEREFVHAQVKRHIDGIGRRGVRLDMFSDFVLQSVGEAGHFQTDRIAGIGNGCGGPAGIGHDADSFAAHRRLCGQRPAVIVKIFNGVDPDDAGLLENTVIEEIRTGHGAGVTQPRARAGGGTAHV